MCAPFSAFAGLSLIPSACHFGSSQIFGQCFGSLVGVEEDVETQLGDFGCPFACTIRALACFWPQDEVLVGGEHFTDFRGRGLSSISRVYFRL